MKNEYEVSEILTLKKHSNISIEICKKSEIIVKRKFLRYFGNINKKILLKSNETFNYRRNFSNFVEKLYCSLTEIDGYIIFHFLQYFMYETMHN